MFIYKNKKIKIFTDGANLDSIINLAKDDFIDGITTNPTLMRKSGVTNYMNFAKAAVNASQGKSISLEVFSDDFDIMIYQAKVLSRLGNSVYVKIPVTNSLGHSTSEVIKKLLKEGIRVNITAILSESQIESCINLFEKRDCGYISIFAGRIADTGKDPSNFIKYANEKLQAKGLKNLEIIWASTREIFNLYQAINCDCSIITIPPEIMKKVKLFDYDLEKLSLETVKMFKSDSDQAKYFIE